MQDLYRIETIRDFDGKPLKYVRFCESKEWCDAYVAGCAEKGVEVKSVLHFKLVPDSNPPKVQEVSRIEIQNQAQ